MSVIFVISPIVVGAAWTALAAAASSAAAVCGFSALETARELEQAEAKKVKAREQIESGVDVDLREQDFENLIHVNEKLVMERDDVIAEFYCDARGRLKLHVVSETRSNAELKRIGEDLRNHVLQQYAYQRVMNEMSQRGFDVVKEEVDAEGRVHVRLAKTRQ